MYRPINLNDIPDGEVFYAVMDRDEGLVGAELDFMSAADQAARIAGDELWYAASPPGGRQAFMEALEFVAGGGGGRRLAMAANPSALGVGPEFALARSGLPQVTWEDVMSLDYDEAYEAIRPFWPTERWRWCELCGGLGTVRPAKFKMLQKHKVKGRPRQPGPCPRCKGVYQDVSQGHWERIETWQDPRAMITPENGLLRLNHKLELKHGRGKGGKSLGLSLVPEFSAFTGQTFSPSRNHKQLPLLWNPKAWNATIRQVKNVTIPLVAPHPANVNSPTLCARATVECASCCLVHTGQNRAERYIVAVKQAAAIALTKQPLAFMRVLTEAVYAHMGTRKTTGKFKHWKPLRKPKTRPYIPYTRLNVFSDIPWELVYPDLFEAIPGVKYQGKTHAFYDYTKVPFRRTPANYDLTFSYSGSRRNRQETIQELESGRRAAVVFLLPYPEKQRYQEYKKGPRKGQKVHGLPSEWQYRDERSGIVDKVRPVVDGDKHDLRSRDSGGVWVGLRFKSAAGILDEHLGEIQVEPGRRGRGPGTASALKSFIVLVEKINGVMTVVQTPRQTEAEDAQ